MFANNLCMEALLYLSHSFICIHWAVFHGKKRGAEWHKSVKDHTHRHLRPHPPIQSRQIRFWTTTSSAATTCSSSNFIDLHQLRFFQIFVLQERTSEWVTPRVCNHQPPSSVYKTRRKNQAHAGNRREPNTNYTSHYYPGSERWLFLLGKKVWQALFLNWDLNIFT